MVHCWLEVTPSSDPLPPAWVLAAVLSGCPHLFKQSTLIFLCFFPTILLPSGCIQLDSEMAPDRGWPLRADLPRSRRSRVGKGRTEASIGGFFQELLGGTDCLPRARQSCGLVSPPRSTGLSRTKADPEDRYSPGDRVVPLDPAMPEALD